MQPAMVITRGGGATRFARSDELAARVMQDVVRESRAGSVAPAAKPQPKPSRNENREPRTRLGAAALRADVATVTALLGELHAFKTAGAPDEPILIRADVIEHALFAAEILPDIDAAHFVDVIPPDLADKDDKSPRELTVGKARLDLVHIEEGMDISQSAGSHFSVFLPGASRQDLRFERFGDGHEHLDILRDDTRLISFARVDYTASLSVRLQDSTIVLNTDAPDAAARVMDVSV